MLVFFGRVSESSALYQGLPAGSYNPSEGMPGKVWVLFSSLKEHLNTGPTIASPRPPQCLV